MQKVNSFIESLKGINGGISSKRVVMYILLLLFVVVVCGNMFLGLKLDTGLQIQLCSLLGTVITYVFLEKKKVDPAAAPIA